MTGVVVGRRYFDASAAARCGAKSIESASRSFKSASVGVFYPSFAAAFLARRRLDSAAWLRWPHQH
jgi:hypothetical protein